MKFKLSSPFKERAASTIFLVSALASILFVALICVFLFANGVPAILKIGFTDFLFGTEWAPTDEPAIYGIFPMILGSLYVTLGALAIGVSVGLLSAIFLARFCSERLHRVLKPAVELLAGPGRIATLEENAGKMALTEAAQVICDEAYKILR